MLVSEGKGAWGQAAGSACREPVEAFRVTGFRFSSVLWTAWHRLGRHQRWSYCGSVCLPPAKTLLRRAALLPEPGGALTAGVLQTGDQCPELLAGAVASSTFSRNLAGFARKRKKARGRARGGRCWREGSCIHPRVAGGGSDKGLRVCVL